MKERIDKDDGSPDKGSKVIPEKPSDAGSRGRGKVCPEEVISKAEEQANRGVSPEKFVKSQAVTRGKYVKIN